jgi:hypothetical protein
MIKEYPILFSAPMVIAILSGNKTETRRTSDVWKKRKPGERLWVREKWACIAGEASNIQSDNDTIYYACDKSKKIVPHCKYRQDDGKQPKWHPSMFMPRFVSRINLEIISIRQERLQDISNEDCIAEGISDEAMNECEHYQIGGSPLRGGSVERCAYSLLWESINGPGSWNDNPLVYVIEFKRI